MLDIPTKFASSPLSSEDNLPTRQSSEEDVSSDDWMPSDYNPPWSSKKEDLEEEDEDEDKDRDKEDDADADADADDDIDNSVSDSNFNFDSPPPKQARRA